MRHEGNVIVTFPQLYRPCNPGISGFSGGEPSEEGVGELTMAGGYGTPDAISFTLSSCPSFPVSWDAKTFFQSARALGDSLIHRADSGKESLVNRALWLLSNAKLPGSAWSSQGSLWSDSKWSKPFDPE